MKFWHRTTDWFKYAPCFGIEDFTLPPARPDSGPTANTAFVHAMCKVCTVRPECAKTAYLEQWNDVWACGVWIPGHDEDKREATLVRRNLFESFASELEERGEDV